MKQGQKKGHDYLLSRQLSWFIRLRWVAALAMMVGTLIDRRFFGWVGHTPEILSLGCLILLYNAGLFFVLRRKLRRDQLLLLAWAQLLLDMAALAILSVWSGGMLSPVARFFVFHMVFASLLLPRKMAYAGAIAALMMLCVGLWVAGLWPQTRLETLALGSAFVTLPATVFVANHITRSLRAHRSKLIRQNRHIRSMTHQLRLQQEALIQHEKLAAMGQMAAGVTHEIANPLASMDSVLQLMQRRPDRLRPEAVTKLREQVGRIQQIIHQMKSFAHPSEMDYQTLDLNDVVEQALGMVKFDQRSRRVTIERQYAPDVGQLPLLPTAVQQVLVNLVINALDAMAQVDDPRLVIRTERREGWCLIELTDNGHGIRSEHMPRLFEPFFTTKPVGKGTGLGLSISYSLIHKQGGSISVRSQEGKGATFTIRLPVASPSSRNRDAGDSAIVISENRRD